MRYSYSSSVLALLEFILSPALEHPSVIHYFVGPLVRSHSYVHSLCSTRYVHSSATRMSTRYVHSYVRPLVGFTRGITRGFTRMSTRGFTSRETSRPTQWIPLVQFGALVSVHSCPLVRSTRGPLVGPESSRLVGTLVSTLINCFTSRELFCEGVGVLVG
jgi:hypothetical protein